METKDLRGEEPVETILPNGAAPGGGTARHRASPHAAARRWT